MKYNEIKFRSNAGLKNKYCLVIGPNGVGKTSFLKEASRNIKNSILIPDYPEKYFFVGDEWGVSSNSLDVMREQLKQYKIEPSDFKVSIKSKKSYFKENFNFALYKIILKKHEEYLPKKINSNIFTNKKNIEKLEPILLWYLLEKYTNFNPKENQNIYAEISAIDSRKTYSHYSQIMMSTMAAAKYVLKHSVNDRMALLVADYINYLEKRRSSKKISLEEVIYNKRLNELSDAGLVVIRNKTDFSAGQKRLFEILLKASVGGVMAKTIIIDEIEMNLHPEWLRNIIEIIDSVFTNSNFLISTHSPIIISGFERKNIKILVRNTKEWKIKSESFGKNTSWILREVMGMEHTYASHAKRVVDKRANQAIKRMEDLLHAETNKKK